MLNESVESNNRFNGILKWITNPKNIRIGSANPNDRHDPLYI